MGGAERGLTVRDWVVAVVAAVVMSVRIAVGPDVAVSGVGEAAAPALALICGLALVWRQRWPWLAGFTAVITSGLTALIAGPVLPVAGWLGIIVVARYVPAFLAAVRAAVFAALGVVVGSGAGAAGTPSAGSTAPWRVPRRESG